MPPFSLDVRDAVTLIGAIVGIAGVIWSQRLGLAKLADKQDVFLANQAEGNRKIDALHKRMDGYGERISRGEIAHAVLVERVDNFRNTQRMRAAARAEAIAAGQVPMFAEGDEG